MQDTLGKKTIDESQKNRQWHGKYEEPQAGCFRLRPGGEVLGDETGEGGSDEDVRLVCL